MDPVQLLAQEGESLRLDAAGLRVLAELGSTPVAVLAVAGMYRTGKSFLLNQLVDAPRFRVGNTTESCTRGIWLCKRFLEGANGGPRVLVLDTEGIDALDVESTHDVRIFALAVLLSSSFAFNSMSHLDEAAVQTLSLMTRVAESVSTEHHAPSLYWVLRDFALQLVDCLLYTSPSPRD